MTPDQIIVHCSDSTWGTIRDVDDWHRQRGFKRLPAYARGDEWLHIGYHRLITNGRDTSNSPYNQAEDGRVYLGRRDDEPGAHAIGSNGRSLGVCLIGRGQYTTRQLASLYLTLLELTNRFQISPSNIIGHCETPHEISQGAAAKKCPIMDMHSVRLAVTGMQIEFFRSFSAAVLGPTK